MKTILEKNYYTILEILFTVLKKCLIKILIEETLNFMILVNLYKYW